jgi:O-acetyl-ADP-ribose deacetylase (regulator of RNase III)
MSISDGMLDRITTFFLKPYKEETPIKRAAAWASTIFLGIVTIGTFQIACATIRHFFVPLPSGIEPQIQKATRRALFPQGQGDLTAKPPAPSWQPIAQDNLACNAEFAPLDQLPSVMESKGSYSAYSRAAKDGQKSYLVLLQGSISERHIKMEKKETACVVNAANESASPSGGGITGALGSISDHAQWKQRTIAAKGGTNRELNLAECVSIEAPFTTELGVKYLFHSLGKRYPSQPDLATIREGLENAYRNIFQTARDLQLDTVECPMISGAIFRPETFLEKDWNDLNSSFFVAEANKWLQEKSGRTAILINNTEKPCQSFSKLLA